MSVMVLSFVLFVFQTRSVVTLTISKILCDFESIETVFLSVSVFKLLIS